MTTALTDNCSYFTFMESKITLCTCQTDRNDMGPASANTTLILRRGNQKLGRNWQLTDAKAPLRNTKCSHMVQPDVHRHTTQADL